MRADAARPAGRPRNPELEGAILAAAQQQLREAGYAGMSLESVAAAAGTTVPAVRRRFASKASVAVAVIDSLRVRRCPPRPGRDPDALASMLIGSFYARYIATSDLPDNWAERVLRHVWPAAPPRH